MADYFRRLAARALVPALLTAVAAAQNPGGEIVGHVTTRTGASMSGVSVTATDGSSTTRTALTDLTGMYRFIGLPAGEYSVTFKEAGFDPLVRSKVTVATGSRVELDATLELAPLEHVDRVTGTPPPAHRDVSMRQGEVLIHTFTSLGEIDIAVDVKHAPITAANFLRYVDGGFYRNGRFHRATRADNYVVNLPNRPLLECIQAGIDPSPKSEGFPPIPLERTSVTGLKHVIGTVSMARGAADTATSDFFILLNDQPSLDFGGKRFDDGQGAAAFGRVAAGMEVVRKIQEQPTEAQSLTPPVRIHQMARAK